MVLQAIETQFGRVRGEPNAPRILDLDILDYQGEVMELATRSSCLTRDCTNAGSF